MAESLQVLSVTCNHCGAPLEVPPSARFVTCRYCNSRLAVHQSGGAAYTEVLEQIDARTQQIASDVETIKLQNELEQLDREWMVDQQNFLERDSEGHSQLSQGLTAASVVGLLLVVGFIIYFISSSASMGAPPIFPIFGVGMLVLVTFAVIRGMKKATEYREAQERCKRRRRDLSAEISRRHDQ